MLSEALEVARRTSEAGVASLVLACLGAANGDHSLAQTRLARTTPAV